MSVFPTEISMPICVGLSGVHYLPGITPGVEHGRQQWMSVWLSLESVAPQIFCKLRLQPSS